MTKGYQLHVEVAKLPADKHGAVIGAVVYAWAYDTDSSSESPAGEGLRISGYEQVPASRPAETFARYIAQIIWEAAGGYYPVRVHAILAEQEPCDEFESTEADYRDLDEASTDVRPPGLPDDVAEHARLPAPDSPPKCPDCGCDVGQPHLDSCDVERCSVCGQQRVTCRGSEGHEPLEAAWTGSFPVTGMTIQALANRVEKMAVGTSNPEPQARAEILDDLSSLFVALGIERAEAGYDGAGDEGAVDSISFEPKDVTIPEGLEDLVEKFVDAILPIGYELDDGAYGTVTIAPGRSPRVEVAHEVRIIDSESNHYSID